MKIMAKPKKKISTPPDQKKITHFFSKRSTDSQQQRQPVQNVVAPRKNKSRIKPQTSSLVPCEVIDIASSGDEEASLAGPAIFQGNGHSNEEILIISKQEYDVQDNPVEEEEDNIVQDEAVEELEIEVDPLAYGIRIVDFSKILEKDSPTKDPSPAKPSSSMLHLLTTPTKAKPFTSPLKPLRSPKRSPKTKLNHFSPIRHLNQRSRSKSLLKTPTKGPSSSSNAQNSPFKSSILNSPLKSLWSSKPDPYYLRNFLTVVNDVIGDSHNSHLLNQEDVEIVQKFHCLTKPSQCLYVRLYNRKKWQRVVNVKYPQIADNLTPMFDELHEKNFLSVLQEDKTGLEELLEIPSYEGILDVCKRLRISFPDKGRNTEKCLAALMKASETQQTLRGSMRDVIYKEALKEAGPTYRISDSSRSLFSRIFTLFSPPQYWDSEADKGSSHLLALLLTEVGQMVYPTYKVKKSRHIYKTRNDIMQFQEAWLLHSSIEAYTESKQWDEVISVGQEAMEKLKLLLENRDIVEYDKTLPAYLRAYVAGSLLTRVCWLGVEGFQKKKDYQNANDFLNFLLNQKIYLPHYRGRWYERLVINSKHSKVLPYRIRQIIRFALTDEHTRDCYKLDLASRLEKLKCDKSEKKTKKKKNPKVKKTKGKKKPQRRTTRSSKNLEENEESSSSEEEKVDTSESSSESDVDEIESVKNFNVAGCHNFQIKYKIVERTIEGEKLPMYDREHGKSMFVGNSGGAPVSGVEQFALQYYRNDGYVFGVHGEGSVPSTLYGLLFWNIIYNDDLPDVFLSPYQSYPLDLFFDDFRTQRELLINEMLFNLRFNWCLNDALTLMEKNWNDNMTKVSIVNWNLFSSFDDLKVLVKSMGLILIAGICDKLSQNYRYYRSGFPDLTVWNLQKCLFAEVKGPGDTLSAKQRHWLDHLQSLNTAVELCTVKAVSNKRIRTS